MPDREDARLLTALARRDLTALEAMHDPVKFAEEIFGFILEFALAFWKYLGVRSDVALFLQLELLTAQKFHRAAPWLVVKPTIKF